MNPSFLSDKRHIQTLSGELELLIMELLWTHGPLPGRDLHMEVKKGKDIAYTTTLTVLDRLSKKGFLKKARGVGRIRFSPEISKEDYRVQVTGSLVRKAFETSPDLAVSAFVDIFSRMERKELDRLEKLIKERRDGALK